MPEVDNPQDSHIIYQPATEAGAIILQPSSEKGKKAGRIQIGTSKDDRFYVKAMKDAFEWSDPLTWPIISSIYRTFWCVPLKISQNETLYISIRSLSTRLLLSEKEINEAAEKSMLAELIQDQAEIVQKRASELEKWEHAGVKGMVREKGSKRLEYFDAVLFTARDRLFQENRANAEFVKDGTLVWKTGTKVHKVKPEEELGRGGFGVVVKVRDVATKTFHAMKVSRPYIRGQRAELRIAASNNEIAMLTYANSGEPIEGIPKVILHRVWVQVPFRSLSAEERQEFLIDHPGVVPSQQVIEREVMIMELIEGKDLDTWAIDGHPSNSEKASITEQMLDLLETISIKKGIAHWDIKPENIKIRNGKPVMLDFGGAGLINEKGDATRADFRRPMIFTPPYCDMHAKNVYDAKAKREGLKHLGNKEKFLEQIAAKYAEALKPETSIERARALDAEISELRAKSEHAQARANVYRAECNRLKRYQDFRQLGITLLQMWCETDIRSLSTRKLYFVPNRYLLGKLPDRELAFFERWLQITHENFQPEMIAQFGREWRQLRNS